MINNNSRRNANEPRHRLHGFSNLHLFKSPPLPSSHGTVSGKLVRLSVESAKLASSGIEDDLLSSTEGAKHDYDWLLTPPGTPDLPSPEGEHQPTLAPPTPKNSLGRISTTSNTNGSSSSRQVVSMSGSSSERKNEGGTRGGRSSYSVRGYCSNRSSPILHSSSSTSSGSSAARPSTPSFCRSTASSRASTPSRVRSSQIPTISTNLHSPPAPPRSLSRSSTPTRRHSTNSMQSQSPSQTTSSTTTTTTTTAAAAARRVELNRRNSTTSPPRTATGGPRPRHQPTPQPVVIPAGFPLETPPNLRTTLPVNRPVSAGRSRPRPATKAPNSEESDQTRRLAVRSSSPVVNRGRRSSEFTPKPLNAPQLYSTAATATATASHNNNNDNAFGFGRRSISKNNKSFDMPIGHKNMDITRNSSGGTHRSQLPISATLFPQSIRTASSTSTHSKQQHGRGNLTLSNGSRNNATISSSSSSFDVERRDERQYFPKLMSEVVDIYDCDESSSRYDYDAMFLKEDSQNTIFFDNGFEYSLPEPSFHLF